MAVEDKTYYGYDTDEERAFGSCLCTAVADRLNCVGTNALGPAILPPSPLELWTVIYSPERIARWQKLFDEAFAAVPAGSLEARRLKLIRSVFLDPTAKRTEEYRKMASVPRELAAFDVDDLRAKKIDPKKLPVSVELLSGGTMDGKRSWCHVDRRPTERRKIPRINLRHVVFTATASEAKIRIANPEARPGERDGINMVSLNPHFEN